MLEREVDIPLQQCGGGVDIPALSRGPQNLSEHRKTLERDRSKDSPTIGEVMVGSLMTHTCRCCHLSERQSVGSVFSDVLDRGAQDLRAQIGGGHDPTVTVGLDNVKSPS